MESVGKILSQRDLRRPAALSTFVSVGNAKQPFSRLIESVILNSEKLPSPLFIQYGTAVVQLPSHCQGSPFIGMEEFAHRVASADLLILHAGAGSLIHAVRAGKCPVIVPRRANVGEHIDDHQVEFSVELSATGKVVLCEDPADIAAAASEALARQKRIVAGDQRPMMVDLVQSILKAAFAKDN